MIYHAGAGTGGADVSGEKNRHFCTGTKRRTTPLNAKAELVPRIHPFRRRCGADSSSSDLHSGNQNVISAPVSCLLTENASVMTGFRPDSFRCFGTVLCAQLRSSGFPFLLRRSLPCGVLRLLYIGWQYVIWGKAKYCAFPSDTIHDMGVICKQFEKNMPHLFQPLEKSRNLCQNKENRPGGVLTARRLDATNHPIRRNL